MLSSFTRSSTCLVVVGRWR